MNINKAVSIRCEGAKTYKLEELVEFQGNLKDLSEENYNKLKREILNHGFSEPVSVWENDGKNYLCNGHQRIRVLKGMAAEGYFIPPIPASVIQADDEKQAKEKILALTSQYGEITDTGLYEFMNEAGINVEFLDDLRFPEIDLDEWKDSYVDPVDVASEEDEVPEPPKTPKTKLGDLIELGEHRLLCGDSTDRAQIDKLMNGQKADMVFTDPPYGIDVNTDWSKFDNDTYLKKVSPNTSYLSTPNRHSKIINDTALLNIDFLFLENYKQIILFGGNYFAQKIPSNIYESGSFLVWDKNGGNEDLNKMFGSSFELAFIYPAKKQDIIYRTWRGAFGRGDGSGFLKGKSNSLETDRTVHPTQKPVRLWLQIIEQLNIENGSCFDPFGGSGSTLIACEKTNRKCFMMEIDPHYVDVIISRWCNYTGKDQIKINGELVRWHTGEIES